MTFVACFDAAGHESDQSHLAVAGLVSSDGDWHEFEQRWRHRIAEDGVSCFRMSEFAHGVGDFSDTSKWTKARREQLLGDLLDLIERHAYRRFGVAVEFRQLQQLVSAEARRHYRITAYSLACRTCAGDVRQWAQSERISSPVQFVFEAGDVGKGAVLDRMKEDGFAEPIFRPKRDSPAGAGFAPLQAADICAYELFLAAKRANVDRWPMRALDKIPGMFGYYEDNALREFDRNVKLAVANEEWWERVLRESDDIS